MTNKTIMAIGAHADDVEFNCGATLSKYKDNGYKIIYVMSTNNMSGGWKIPDADGKIVVHKRPWHEIMPQRKREAAEAAKFYGTEVIHLDHPQRHFLNDEGQLVSLAYGAERPEGVPPGAPSILTAFEHKPSVESLANLILEHKPEAILSHSMITGNMEHIGSCLLVTRAYEAAAKKDHTGMLLYWQDITPAPVREAYATWDTFIDVSDYWDKKLEALLIHGSQIENTDRLDFPEVGPACGCRHAETYVIANRGRLPIPPAPAFSLEILNNKR